MTKQFDMRGGRYSVLSDGSDTWWVMEREWLFNRSGESCVPRDEYTLEPHSSDRYPNTFAVIGDGVSHYKEVGIPRFACVFHQAVFPADLEGCLSPCRGIMANGSTFDSARAMNEVRELFRSAIKPIKILMQ
jgi:hypothetical protein